jgi:hypothetical protein
MSNYNAYDIERYLNRQMNAAEMHAFEKAMMNNPFLADAVDGFRTVVPQQNIQHDLELLQERINRKKENGKVVSGFTRPWMQMAAVAIILLSASVVLYRFLNSPVANEQSTVSEKPKSTAPVISQPTVVDSAAVAINEVQPQENHTLLPVSSKKMKLPAAPSASATSITSNEPVIADSNIVATSDIAAVLPPTYAAEASIEAKQNTEAFAKKEAKARVATVKLNRFVGVVVDENNQPLPFANITEVKSGVGTYADAKGNFVMVAADSVLSIETKSVGYNTANLFIRNNQQQKIVLRDEAVSYESLSKEQLFERNKMRTGKMKEELSEMESEPIDGWDNYSMYVLNNTRNSRFTDEKIRLKDKAAAKEVEVSFDVLPDGNIANFKVERSNCVTCNNEAIRVLKEGPKWKSKTGKTERTRFTVRF